MMQIAQPNPASWHHDRIVANRPSLEKSSQPPLPPVFGVQNHRQRPIREPIRKKGVRVCVCVCLCVCVHLTHGTAWMIASREQYAPISCILLMMHHQMFQECRPIVQTQDPPRELPSTGEHDTSQLGSQGEPWPDVASWQGQESQLSLASTQGVDALI